MKQTPEQDTIESTPRFAGLAGSAARALQAARGGEPSTPPADPPDADDTDTDDTDTDTEEHPDAPPVLATVRSSKRAAATTTRARTSGPTMSGPTKSRLTTSELSKSEPRESVPREAEPRKAEPRKAEPRKSEPSAGATGSRLVAISALLTAAMLVFAVIAGVLWWRAGHNDTRDAAAARDKVAVDARLAIATVNTSDYRKAANALTNWIDVATGSLEQQFTTSRASATTLLTQAKTITTATVLDVAVTKLDVSGGSATVIASVNVKKQPVTGAATTVRNRFRASMSRVDGEWKLADLAQVDVQLS